MVTKGGIKTDTRIFRPPKLLILLFISTSYWDVRCLSFCHGAGPRITGSRKFSDRGPKRVSQLVWITAIVTTMASSEIPYRDGEIAVAGR
jgi:hypothetical protein